MELTFNYFQERMIDSFEDQRVIRRLIFKQITGGWSSTRESEIRRPLLSLDTKLIADNGIHQMRYS